MLIRLITVSYERNGLPRQLKDGGVVVDTNAYESSIAGHIVDAARDRLANGGSGKVVHVDKFWLAFGLPLASTVFEVADELLLLRSDGNHRNSVADACLSLGIDVLELRVTIRVLVTAGRKIDRLLIPRTLRADSAQVVL